ncbi:MAG: hypothetical protein ABEJ25_04405 [Candidatus Bipolaricaulia bacterium]
MNKRDVLIVGGQGEVRGGIKALVEAIPEVGQVTCFDDIDRRSDRIAELNPDLVIFDYSQLNEGYRSRLRQLRRLLPLTRILTLVEEEEQRTISRESGADAILVKGFRGDLLIRTVRSLIRIGNGRETRINDNGQEG